MSSAAIMSTSFKTRIARKVMSSKFPIGVDTMYSDGIIIVSRSYIYRTIILHYWLDMCLQALCCGLLQKF